MNFTISDWKIEYRHLDFDFRRYESCSLNYCKIDIM